MKSLAVILFLMLATKSYGQQLPVFSQTLNNKVIVNPATCGAEEDASMFLHHRTQWVGFEGAPSSQILSGSSRYKDKNFGLGGYVFNDVTGPLRTTGVNLAYGYQFPVAKDIKLSLGLSSSFFQLGVDGSKISTGIKQDPLIDQNANFTNYVLDFTFGAYLYHQDYFVGLSILNLSKSNPEVFDGMDEQASIKAEHHYYLIGGYRTKLKEHSTIQPSLVINYMVNNPTRIEANVQYEYKERFLAGIGYRMADAVIMRLGIRMRKAWLISYSFDLTSSELSSSSSGSHEIVLGYRFGQEVEVKPPVLID